jgi:hypothetical protein
MLFWYVSSDLQFRRITGSEEQHLKLNKMTQRDKLAHTAGDQVSAFSLIGHSDLQIMWPLRSSKMVTST